MEIAFNDGDDLHDAQNKIENAVVPQIGATCSCVLIVLQRRPSDTYLKRMGRLDAQGSLLDLNDDTQPAQAVEPSTRPSRAPYVGCWPFNATTPTWYLVQRDLHLDIPVINNRTFRLKFNRVLECYGAA